MRAETASPVYDVIVVGAGPTGLTLVNLLGVAGLSVLLVERNATTVQEPRAVSVDDESLRTMQAAGVIDQVLTQVVPGYGSRYLTPGGACFLTVMPTGTPYGYPRRNAFRQPILEQQLRDGLQRFANVQALFGARMAAFEQHAGGVGLTVEIDGEQRVVEGRYLVGCDGASSPIRKMLGFKLEGETLPERWLIVDLADSPADRHTSVFCDYDRPCIALPGPDDTRRFEFKLFDDEADADILRPDVVAQLLQSRGVAPGSRIVRQTVYTFHARIADHWADRRVFLAGDAVHLTPPFAGQGMNSGIRDAHNLAWKLVEVVNGRLHENVLATYEVERRDHVAGMIDLALRMGRIMGPVSRWRGRLTQTAFRIAGLWPPLRSYFGEMKYKPRPYFKDGFLLPSPHPLVGRLLAQPSVEVPDGSSVLLDTLLPNGFVLLGLDVARADVMSVAQRLPTGRVSIGSGAVALSEQARAGHPSLLRLVDPDPALVACSGSLLLVRPDRYVMAAFAPHEVATVASRLEPLFRTGDPMSIEQSSSALLPAAAA